MTAAPLLPHQPAPFLSVRKRLVGLLALVVLTVAGAGLLTSIQLAQLPQDLTKEAAPATTLSLIAPTTALPVNQVFNINLTANTGSNVVRALDIGIQYDPDILQLQNITPGPWLDKADVIVKRIDRAHGVARISFVLPPTAQPNYVTGQGRAAVLVFKVLKAKSGTVVRFNRVLSIAGAAHEPRDVIANYVDATFATGVILSPTPSVTPVLSTTPGPTTKPSPSPTVTPGPTSPPDGGIHRSCNEYCANSAQCGSGLTCWYNQCRNPKDTTQVNCKLPLAPGQVESCNLYCANNSECAGGLTCWYNKCRLAGNLQSESCQLPTPTPTKTTGSTNTTGNSTSAKPSPTPTGLKVVVKAVIDQDPVPTPAVSRASTPRPTAKPTVKAQPTSSAPQKTTGNPLSWVPVILGLIVVVVVVLIAGPQVKALLSPPKARVMPVPATPPPTVARPMAQTATGTTTPPTRPVVGQSPPPPAKKV